MAHSACSPGPAVGMMENNKADGSFRLDNLLLLHSLILVDYEQQYPPDDGNDDAIHEVADPGSTLKPANAELRKP